MITPVSNHQDSIGKLRIRPGSHVPAGYGFETSMHPPPMHLPYAHSAHQCTQLPVGSKALLIDRHPSPIRLHLARQSPEARLPGSHQND